MKKKLLTTLLVAVLMLSLLGTVFAGNMPSWAVKEMQFPGVNLPQPQTIKFFNKAKGIGNGIFCEMTVGKDNKTFMSVWKPNSGKRDMYVWNGSQWVYQYSLTNIVPGFEEPKTINSYKYATWDDYIHTVPTNGNITPNPVNPTNTLTVTLTGPDKLSVNEQGKYTAHISGGTPPYTLTWSSDGYQSSSNSDAYYKWNKEGTYTVEVSVRDLNGNESSANMTVKVEGPYKVDVTFPTENIFVYTNAGYVSVNGYESDKDCIDIKLTDATKKIKSLPLSALSFKINGVKTDKIQRFSANEIDFDSNGNAEIKAWIADRSGVPDPAGLPTGPVNVSVSVNFGSKTIEKQGTINLLFAKRFMADIYSCDSSNGTAQRIKYHYFVTVIKETAENVEGQIKVKVTAYVKEIESNKYYNTIEALKNSTDYKKGLQDVVNNPDATSSNTVSPNQLDASAVMKPTTDVLNAVGASQKTSDNTLNVDISSSSNGVELKGALASNNGKDVHPYTTRQTVNVVYAYQTEIKSYDPTLQKYDDYPGSYGSRVTMNPDLLSHVTVIKLPKRVIAGEYVVFTPHDYMVYEIQPSYDNGYMVSTDISGCDTYLFDSDTKKWQIIDYLDPPKTFPSSLDQDTVGFGVSYTNKASSIMSAVAIPSSITVNKVIDSSGTTVGSGMVEFVLSSGDYLNPKTSFTKDIYDSSDHNKLIAIASVDHDGITVYGINKGKGILSLSSNDLAGPYGVNIPIDVQRAPGLGNVSFTVNNKQNPVNWFGPLPANSDGETKWYRMVHSSYGGWNHAYWYIIKKNPYTGKDEINWYYHEGDYTAVIHNTGDVVLKITCSYEYPDGNEEVTYIINPGDSKTFHAGTWRIAQKAKGLQSGDSFNVLYTFTIFAKQGNGWIQIGSDNETVEIGG